jgi:hypothetical protein
VPKKDRSIPWRHLDLGGSCSPKCIIHGSSCTARFEDDGPASATTYGPFDRVEFVDGSVRVEPGRHLLARLDEQERTWYSYEDGRSWQRLVVQKAS